MNTNISNRPGLATRASMALLIPGLIALASVQMCKKPDQSGADTGSRSSYSENLDKDREKISITHIGNELSVEIAIPRAHHAYLDNGKEGNLIPISFDWKDMIRDGSLGGKPRLLKKPVGKFDEKVEATVLRGKGTFVFAHTGSKWPAGKRFKVLTQICNETTGQCYPPSYNSVIIP